MTTIKNELPKGFELFGKSRKYTILNKLGAGGFGITYKVKAPLTVGTISVTANFCIKEFFPAKDCERLANSCMNYSNPARERVENARRDFISEARRLKKIGFSNHNIVGFDEVFEANNTAYYVMEFIDGVTLKEYVEKNGPLTEEETRTLMFPVIEAVSLLHKYKICHLDVKPGNIMLGHEEDGSLRPVLIDFGLSKHYDNSGNPTTTINTVGVSEGYSPKEQYSGITSFSPGADIYALGATLWFCLTGRQPKSSLEIREGELATELPDNISSDMRKLIEQMTLDKRNRPNSIGDLDMFNDLRTVGPATHNPVITKIKKRRSGIRKNWILYSVIAIVAIVIGFLATFTFNHNDEDNAASIAEDSLTSDSSLQKKPTKALEIPQERSPQSEASAPVQTTTSETTATETKEKTGKKADNANFNNNNEQNKKREGRKEINKKNKPKIQPIPIPGKDESTKPMKDPASDQKSSEEKTKPKPIIF